MSVQDVLVLQVIYGVAVVSSAVLGTAGAFFGGISSKKYLIFLLPLSLRHVLLRLIWQPSPGGP